MRAKTDERFQELWDQNHARILAYCLRRVPSTDAEDACAEVFMVAWRRIDKVPRPPDTTRYLYGIARRVVANQGRSRLRRSRLNKKLAGTTTPVSVDPGLMVIQNADDAAVATAVRNLKPTDREIVMLYAWEDLTRAEIAEIMGMSRDAIDQRIHRAYKRLGRVLEPALLARPANSPPFAEEGGT